MTTNTTHEAPAPQTAPSLNPDIIAPDFLKDSSTPIGKDFRCSTVAILGRPNAGKSTLLNALLSSEFSGTSDRPQTTRQNIKGILQRYNDESGRKEWVGQHVLVDTPGVNLRKGLLDRSMYASIEDAMREVDIALWVADCRSFERDLDDIAMDRSGRDDRLALWLRDQVRSKDKTKWILVLSKVDLKSKAELLPLIEKANEVMPEFAEIVPLCALQGLAQAKSNVSALLEVIDSKAPKGPPLYPEESWTDMNSRELLRNLIRETIFRNSYKEVPYECDCLIEMWQDPHGKKKMTEVDATIVVSRPSLKQILVGKGGQNIKSIGITVRKRWEEITGEAMVLRLFVKVVEKWHLMPNQLRELGYESGK